MFAHRLLRRPVTRAQAVTEVVLAALLAAQPAIWIWTLNSSRPAPAPTALAGPVLSPPASAAADPFFRLASQAPLTAHTLYAVRTGAGGGAIVAGPDGVQRAAAVGETVSEGVVLAAVAQDHVILAHGGGRTRLDFPASPPPSTSPPPPPATTRTGQVAAGPGAADAATYATALRPVSENGADGYVWRPGAEGGVLAAAGLRPGDVIVGINGTPFDRAERMEELAADVAAGHAVDLEYRRNGVVFSARYPSE